MSDTYKFKVGDKVKVVKSNISVKNGVDKGRCGVISKVRVGAYDYEVNFGEELTFTHTGVDHTTPNYRYYDEGYLELVEKETYTTKYKPGDEVTVRSDLTCAKDYRMANHTNNMTPCDQMLTKRGKKVKIKSITKTGKYMIEGSIFPWVDEMFVDEAEVKPTGKKYKVCDHVKITYWG